VPLQGEVFLKTQRVLPRSSGHQMTFLNKEGPAKNQFRRNEELIFRRPQNTLIVAL
jgi:hypothetical protein